MKYDISDCVVDNLMVAKYGRVIRGYTLHNGKKYATIYVNKECKINVNYNTLFDLFTKGQFETYIKIKGAKHEVQQEVCRTMGV